MTKLTHQQKLDALAYRFYQGAAWVPKAGDFYTTSRADLELYQVVSVENGVVRTRFTEGSDAIAEWPADEFLSGGFGPKRVFVPEWVIGAQPTMPSDQMAKTTAEFAADNPAHFDNISVEAFAYAMRTKLAVKRLEGRGGWQDKEACSAEYLSRLLREHVDKGDPIDIANFAMMLHQRGERITPPASAALEITNPATIDQFRQALAARGVKLPLQTADDDLATLIDMAGTPVLVVDVNRERSDEEAAWITGLIQVAVNTCGGFKAKRVAG